MLYYGTLLLMDHEDGSYQIYDPTEQPGDDYDRVIWDGVAYEFLESMLKTGLVDIYR